MDLVVATHTLGIGGSETYALTLAEQLQRLGHSVAICATVLDAGEAIARARGIDVVSLDRYDRSRCDGVIAQDGGTAFELARRHPAAPLVFVAHSEEFDEQLPPLLAEFVGAVVVLNDRVERRVRALAADLAVVRLRQPIDVKRFRPRSAPSERPSRLLVLGNNLDGARRELVADVAEELGMSLTCVGSRAESIAGPEWAISDADVVMGYGRCALEGMACGRPTYVYDHLGGDGWVTPTTYSALEADGFGGRAHWDVVDRERLLADLRAYHASMGLRNRDLVVGAHRAEHHTQQVLDLLTSLGPVRREGTDALGELAALVRARWAADARIDELEGRVVGLERVLATERAQAEAAHAARDALIRTRRYRIGAALARPFDLARGRADRR